MKKFYIFFILLILAILGGTVAFFYLWNKPKESIATVTPDYSIATQDFAAEFWKDTAAAERKYAGKVVVLSGVVDEVETDAAGFVNLIFSEDSLDIQCTLDSASTITRKFQPKDSVTLKGNYIGYLQDEIFGMQIKLNNCFPEK